jgi:DMSO/TMAO reductase YedYZ molybdopterin-dependent catalytic subunit
MENKRIIISPINLREDRLPPGQRWIDNPIPYDISSNTDFDEENYKIDFFGEVENPISLSYKELFKFPQVELIADFHCVTHWSVKEIHWEGVQVKEILKIVKPKASYVLIHSKEGYTTNTLTDYLFEEDVIIAYKMNGDILPKRHGFPLRLVIPKLYAWKSAKYLSGFEFLKENKPGYWEERGYHIHADPWKNERYSR